jgi:hypothetical protein
MLFEIGEIFSANSLFSVSRSSLTRKVIFHDTVILISEFCSNTVHSFVLREAQW